ncbi:MAG: thermonuclease family protein [Actinomycetota bacterium]|nr:thermonuclease family protein [Actinomycetota bacterium]
MTEPPELEDEGQAYAETQEQLGEDQKPAKAQDMVPAERARLISVTDGDTVRVGLANGSRANVRVIGIDTPETYPVIECGGPEATANMQHMVGPGDMVNLYIDPTQDEVDRHGRLLRYVFTADDRDVGLDQIGTGHAIVYVYNNNPFVALDVYQEAEDDARSNNGGISGAC